MGSCSGVFMRRPYAREDIFATKVLGRLAGVIRAGGRGRPAPPARRHGQGHPPQGVAQDAPGTSGHTDRRSADRGAGRDPEPMKAETDLHQAMDAVAATTLSLDTATLLARGKRDRTRRRALLTGTVGGHAEEPSASVGTDSAAPRRRVGRARSWEAARGFGVHRPERRAAAQHELPASDLRAGCGIGWDGRSDSARPPAHGGESGRDGGRQRQGGAADAQAGLGVDDGRRARRALQWRSGRGRQPAGRGGRGAGCGLFADWHVRRRCSGP
ncbi:hypothetical protein GUI43_05004 [Micromonospora noduli]|nr:hypothetical protein GUI43_05004 [Micromonospora noduli]